MTTVARNINGLDVGQLRSLVETVTRDPAEGVARFHVSTGWTGGARSETRVDHWELGGRRMRRSFTIRTDEPPELLGAARDANPQEVLMGALNACMMVGYVAGCALKGIQIKSLEIETEGALDLRGFLGLDRKVSPGYEELSCTVRIEADAPEEELRQVHELVQKTSPNFWNITQPVRLKPRLVIA